MNLNLDEEEIDLMVRAISKTKTPLPFVWGVITQVTNWRIATGSSTTSWPRV
jgi:hypothetical protein